MNNLINKGLSFILLFILISSNIFSTNSENKMIPNANATSMWIENNVTNLKNGTLNNVILTDEGNVKLKSKFSFFTKDNFYNTLNINIFRNLLIDKENGKIKLYVINKTFGKKVMDSGYEFKQTSDKGFIIVGTGEIYSNDDERSSRESKRASGSVASLIKTDELGNLKWNKIFGGNGYDVTSSIQITFDNGYILSGTTTSYGNGNYDAWLIKTDRNGKEQWNKTYGGSYADYGGEVLITPDNGYIFDGSFDGVNTLVKTYSNGIMQWNKTHGIGHAYKLKHTFDGGYIMCGHTPPYGPFDIWESKIDKNGNMEWNNTFSGGPYWDQLGNIIQTSDGGYIIACESEREINGNFFKYIWLIKLNNTGDMQWERTYGGNPFAMGRDVLQAEDGGYFILGALERKGPFTDNIWLIKTDKNGDVEWSRTYGGESREFPISIIQTRDKNLVILGSTYSYKNGSVWLLKTDEFGNDKPTGILYSTNLFATENVSQITDFHYSCSLPKDPVINKSTYINVTRIGVQFSQDNKSWFNSNGKLNKWNLLKNGINSIDLSSLSWKGANFYYRMNLTTTFNEIPELDYIQVNYTQYHSSGRYISQPFDSGGRTSWKTLYWESFEPTGTNIKFQLRTSKTKEGLLSKTFVGPDGKSSSYYTSSGTAIWPKHENERWMQYIAYLTTADKSQTPILNSVTLKFNLLPTTILVSPFNASIYDNTTPVFTWNFSDKDSEEQAAFQLIISDDIYFTNIFFDTGEYNSTNQYWQYHNDSEFNNLYDGVWYWKVRTKDSDGDWGFYSAPYKVIINTQIPRSIITFPVNNGLYQNLNRITGKAWTPLKNSILTKVQINIRREADNYYWNGYNWSSNQAWLMTKGTNLWSYNTTSVSWTLDTQYTIQSRAMDNKDNQEIPTTGVNFMIKENIARPFSEINNPINMSFINKLNKISGRSFGTEFLNVEKVEISIKNLEDNHYWDGVNWSSKIIWLDVNVNGTDSWSFDSSEVQWESDIYYLVRSRVIDNNGNFETPKFGNKFMYDNLPPKHLSLIINNNSKYANSTAVHLSINAEDTGSGIDQMAFSNDNVNWTSWENFSRTKNYNLTSGNGEKIIYYKIKDRAGNIATSSSKKIILNTSLEISDIDNDNILDIFDAFPLDPAASIDSDGDKYPDCWNPGKSQKDSTTGLELDEFPNDPNRHSTDNKPEFKFSALYLGIILMAMIITVMIVILSTIFKKRSNKKITESPENRIIEKLKKDIVLGKTIELEKLSKKKLQILLNEMHNNGEVTDETYYDIKTELQELEYNSHYREKF